MHLRNICLWIATSCFCSLAHAQQAPAGDTSAQDNKPAETTVTKSGTAIVYDGYLTPEANQRAASLIDKHTRALIINSRGGEVGNGMDLGEIVFSHGLDVEVAGHCFSSCANYVFPAGRRKILRQHSQLGWHGGVTQKMDFAGDREMEALHQAYIKDMLPRETAYFSKIGVDQASTTAGQQAAYDAYTNCVGWTYPLSVMRAFGMRNIVLKDGIWAPPGTFEGKCIFTVMKMETDKRAKARTAER